MNELSKKPAAGAGIVPSNSVLEKRKSNPAEKIDTASSSNSKQKKKKVPKTTSATTTTSSSEPAAGAVIIPATSGTSTGSSSLIPTIVVAAVITALTINTAAEAVTTTQKKTIGFEHTLYRSMPDPVNPDKFLRCAESRIMRARRLGLRINGKNAEIQEAIDKEYLLRQFAPENNANLVSGGRGQSTTDSHVRKVCSSSLIVDSRVL